MKNLLISLLSLHGVVFAQTLSLEDQVHACRDYTPPGDFKAFNLADCAAQLTLTKDRYVGVQWRFEATYADGSRFEHEPYRDFDTFGVSDSFYPYLGNNFITRHPGNTAFTAVHEFTGVCKSGRYPVSWRFYTSSGSNPDCSQDGERYTTSQIRAIDGKTRPPKVTGVSIRRSNDAGDFSISWSATTSAAAYSVIVEYPSGTDEVGRPYLNVRGARVKGTTSTVIPTTNRRQDVDRKVIVHAVDSHGVWSFTKEVKPVTASW